MGLRLEFLKKIVTLKTSTKKLKIIHQMSYIENLKENITYLNRFNPNLAKALLKIDVEFTGTFFELQNTDKNELNLLYKKKFLPYYFHSQKGAVQESADFFEATTPQAEVLYVFGVGLGYSFFRLRKWLEKHPNCQVVYIEPLLPVIFYLLQTEIGKNIIKHPRVHLYHYKGKLELSRLIEHLAVDFAPKTVQVIALPPYLKKYPKTINFFRFHIERMQENLAVILEETDDSREDFFRNFSLSAQAFNKRYNGSLAHQIFKDIPCIIVGAGPSLKKNLPLLKKLKDHALILAGSSAISSLTQQNLIPHVGSYFDPYERLYPRFKTNTAFELPTFLAPRTYFEVSKKVHGPKIYFKGSQTTPFVNWIEDSLNFVGEQINELISVTAFNTQAAILMGCNPIIYVGVDLAYTENQNYSEGIVQDIKERKKFFKGKKFSFQFNADLEAVDIFKKPIFTRHGWVLESQILGEIAANKPSISFLNCTEGGIGMPGINNLPLQQAFDLFLKRSYPIEEMLMSEIQPLRVLDNNLNKRAVKQLKDFGKSLNRCSKIYHEALNILKALYQKNKKGNLTELNLDFFSDIMAKLGHEIAYQYLLKRYHQKVDILRMKHRHLVKNLSLDAPLTLIYEVKLVDLINHFKEYKIICDRIRIILKHAIKQGKIDLWQ